MENDRDASNTYAINLVNGNVQSKALLWATSFYSNSKDIFTGTSDRNHPSLVEIFDECPPGYVGEPQKEGALSTDYTQVVGECENEDDFYI